MENKTMFEELADWQSERLGKITASEIHKIMKSGRGKDEYFGQTALSYLDEKIAEIITGVPCKDLTGMNAIEWGNAHENEAIMALEEKTGLQVEYFGGANPKFFPFNSFSGGSPDGIADEYVVEVKCPYNSGVHAKNLIASLSGKGNEWLQKHREEYFFQVQFNIMCCKRDKALFISYDPRPTEEKHRLAIMEIFKDETICSLIAERLQNAGEIVKQSIDLLYRDNIALAHYDTQLGATIVESEISLSKLKKI